MKNPNVRKYVKNLFCTALMTAGTGNLFWDAVPVCAEVISEIKTGESVTITNSDWNSILASSVTMSGGTLVSNNTGTTGTYFISTAFSFADGTSSVISSNGNSHLGISSAVTGNGTFRKSGGQQILLSGNNSGFTGTAVVETQWFNFQNKNAAFSKGTLQFSGGAGIVLNPGADGEAFEFGMITTTTGTPMIRMTSGNLRDAVLKVGGTNASGVFGGVITDYLTAGAADVSVMSVTKTGTGTWTLTGTNAYTGATVIEGGTLRIGNHGTSGLLAGMSDTDTAPAASTDITVKSGGKLSYDLTYNAGAANQVRIYNNITFNGGSVDSIGTKGVLLCGEIGGTEMTAAGGTIFFQSGTSTGGAKVSVPVINVTGGTLATKVALDSATALNINGGSFQFGSAYAATAGSISSAAVINVASAGTLAVYSQNIGASLVFNGGTLSGLGGTAAVLSGSLTGSGLTKNGDGNVKLTGTNAVTGTVAVTAGILTSSHSHSGNISVSGASSYFRLGNGGTSGSMADTITVALSNGGTFELSRSYDTSNFTTSTKFTISNGGTIQTSGGKNLVLQGTVSGNNLTLSNTGSGTLFLQDVGNFTGLTGTLTVAKGLIVEKNAAVGSASSPLSVVVDDGATLQMGNDKSQVIPKIFGTVKLAGNGLMTFQGAGGATQSYAISSAAPGEGRVQLDANAAYNFTANNSAFTGEFIVNKGTLNAYGTENTLGNSKMTVKSGTTVNVNGNQNLQTLTLDSNSTLNLKKGILTVSGAVSALENELRINVTGIDTASLIFQNDAVFDDTKFMLYSENPDSLDVNGTYEFLRTSAMSGFTFELSEEILNTGLSVLQISSGVYALTLDRGTVPEPASWLLFVLCSAGLAAACRRKKK